MKFAGFDHRADDPDHIDLEQHRDNRVTIMVARTRAENSPSALPDQFIRRVPCRVHDGGVRLQDALSFAAPGSTRR
jgi:hypothetical protein